MRRIGGSLKASLRASAKLKSFIRNNKTVEHRTQLFLIFRLPRLADYFQ